MASTSTVTRAPKYVRLAETIREQVATGVLKPGDQLPSYAQFQAKHGVAQATLDRVYALLEQEKLIVRTPKMGTFVLEPPKVKRTKVAGVVMPVASPQHYYYMRLLQGIQQVTCEENQPLMILNETAIDWDAVDGVMLADVDSKAPRGKLTVSLLREMPGVDCVVPDDHGGMVMLTRHLVDLGHRKIAFLTGGVQNLPDIACCHRLRGYQGVLSEAGISYQRKLVRPLYDPLEPFVEFSQVGYEKMRRWINEDWRALGATAILAHNDEVAIGVMRALYEAGISVPDEVSVAGFDGLELGQQLRPSLTTVEVPLTEIGALGTRIFLEKLEAAQSEDPRREVGIKVVPVKLRRCESTAAPRH